VSQPPTYHQPPAYPPPPGYPQAPIASPKKKSKVPLILGIVAAVLVVMCGGAVACFALVGNAVNDVVTTTGTPNNDNNTNGAGGEQPAGPVNVAVGQTIVVRNSLLGDTTTVEYTVRRTKQVRGSEFLKPEHGVYLAADLEIKVTKGSEFACGCDISVVGADGTVYEQTIYIGDDAKPNFDGADLKEGQRKAGWVVFDVPADVAKTGKIQVKNFWDDAPYGFWTL
jgi:Domain of unknown function (DUF4352)